IANVSSSATAGKPLVVPEFNCPWPNEWRAECLPMMAAYGRLQDWDGLLFFAYQPDGANREKLTSFGTQSDPVHWGQIPLAALLFLRGDVSPARVTVHVGVSTVDAFATRPQRNSDRYSPYRVLPYLSRVRNVYFDQRYEGDADVVISSGHSATGDYRAAKRAILFADSPFVDETASRPDRANLARLNFPGIQTVPGEAPFDTRFAPTLLPAGAQPIRRGGAVVGFHTQRFCVYPNASAEEAEDPAWLHRLYLEMAGEWKLPGAAPPAEAGNIFRSDTGELVLDRQKGLFTVVTPRAIVATGRLRAAGALKLGPVEVTCRTPFASVGMVSLDGKPLVQSARLLLTGVARSQNTGQVVSEVNPRAGAPLAIDADTGAILRTGQHALDEPGHAPVLAEPVDARVRLPGGGRWKAISLGPRGEPERALKATDGVLETNEAQSPWVLITRE
ncbi:MAG: hypothetical protein QHJ73_15390, partial [Armatimonadota bacterium]|nr:hypothetical protein [Armatimonadota bacterium]